MPVCAPFPPKARSAALLAHAVALIALLAACGASPGRLLIVDEAGALDRAQVEAAAAPLLERGATVAVFIVTQSPAPEADMASRLDAAAMLSADAILPSGIAVYASLEPRYSELRAGSRWSRRLPDAALREVRLARLNPALEAGQITSGVASALAAIDARASAPTLGELVSWGVLSAFLIAALIGAIRLSPLGDAIGRRWRGSPPSNLVAALWDRTPWGHARLLRILRTVELRMDGRAQYARSWCQAAASTNRRDVGAPLMARLRELDRERKRLQQAPAGRRQLVGFERLADDYTNLGREAERVSPRSAQKAVPGAAGSAFVAGAAAAQGGSSSESGAWDGPSAGSYDPPEPSRDGGDW